MIAVIFELEPKPGQSETYFNLAVDLRPLLEETEGFISVERFESLAQPGKFLSLSFWQDETAVARWRNVPAHRKGQTESRAKIFAHYRLRVAAIMRDYGLDDRTDAPSDSRLLHG